MIHFLSDKCFYVKHNKNKPNKLLYCNETCLNDFKHLDGVVAYCQELGNKGEMTGNFNLYKKCFCLTNQQYDEKSNK